jgi:predicted O-methyltransferase YrrM
MPMLRKLVKRTSRRVAPKWADRVEGWWLLRQADALRGRCSAIHNLDELVELFLRSRTFRVNQKHVEILSLLRLLQREPPHFVCEIGGDKGGTLSLFAQVAAPDARLLSLDINYRSALTRALPRFARPRQQITCLAADSHASETEATVRGWLGGERLDFLFIDGDHLLDGVARDFARYAPFVRPGGTIALHDIVSDHRARYGRETTCDTGGVPIFWNQLKAEGRSPTREFIADREQDGYGLGVVFWPG